MLSKRAPITGTRRRHLSVALRRAYTKGVPIRLLAEICGRSYGFVHRLLIEADAVMAPRGGRHMGRAGRSAWQIAAAASTFERELEDLCGGLGKNSG